MNRIGRYRNLNLTWEMRIEIPGANHVPLFRLKTDIV